MRQAVKIPSTVTAGTTFYVPCPDGLMLYLRGPQSIDVHSENGAFRVEAPETAHWPSGCYLFSVRRDENGVVSEVLSGSIQILPDITTLSAGSDIRTSNQRTYDAICAVIEKRASLDQQEYKINNRELKRTPITDLLKLRAYYASLVQRERGISGFREHKVIF